MTIVDVQQCDREAAAALHMQYGEKLSATQTLEGRNDSLMVVQAFARHRLAALASAPAGDPLAAALAEIVRLRLATSEGTLRVRADLMWQIATTALARPHSAVAPAGDGRMLPCPNPWCDSGSAPFMHHVVSHREEWAVSCGCGFLGPILDTPERAEAAWNTRRAAVAPAGDGGGADKDGGIVTPQHPAYQRPLSSAKNAEDEDAELLADANSWYSSVQLEEIAREVERRECKIADDMSRHDDWQKHRHAEYVAAEIAEGIAAALARPRAAVWEREAAEKLADALQAHGVDEDMANLNPDMVPHVREAWLDLARTAILALQSPPAKVEG